MKRVRAQRTAAMDSAALQLRNELTARLQALADGSATEGAQLAP